MSNIFKLNWHDVLGAVVSSVIVAVLTYIVSLTSIFSVDVKGLIDVAVLTAATSLLKSFATTSDGKLLGAIKIK